MAVDKVILMVTNMNFTLSEHAKAEMVRRQISLAWIESMMRAPEQILPSINGRVVYQSRIVNEGKTFLLRLVIEEWRHPPVIVTAYRTSKIEKYWREL
jgi:hypothetical protein